MTWTILIPFLIFAFFVFLSAFLIVLALGAIKPGCPKDKKQTPVLFGQFGVGSIHEFAWYFEGDSLVAVSSIGEICRWLRGCEYVHDPVLFMQTDFWQHPLTFEQIKKGDCEDHALWAWRKLVELGVKAEFIVGDTEKERHAWVVFERNRTKYLFETTAKNEKMVYTLEETKNLYRPEFGVDQNLKTYKY